MVLHRPIEITALIRSWAAFCRLPDYKSVINALIMLSQFFPCDDGFERAGLLNAKHGSGGG
jgi:hypothetical protein